MQIVIDINEHLYKMIKTLGLVVEDGDAVVVSEAIKNGTPLDDVKAEIEDCSFDYYFEYGEYIGENPVQHRICMTDKVLEILSKAESEE